MIKILWLDDDYYRLQDLKTILELSGYNIIFCRGIESAIRAINTNNDISLFILDMMLYDDDFPFKLPANGLYTGYDFYNQFLRNNFSKTPIIFLSAVPNMYEIFKFQSPDENITFLDKPIDNEYLLQIIKEILRLTDNN